MTKLGLILGNRDFFPDKLIGEARNDFEKLSKKLEVEWICPTPEQTKLGGVESYADACRCAKLFKEHADEIEGIVVSLPNFGDEKGVADVIRMAGLNVPILIQAYPDDLDKLSPAFRRDGFCGKISVCNNLVQRDIPFSLTESHTVHPLDAAFEADLRHFTGVCRVVNGLRKVRLGAVGARPGAFNTVRYSEKILERAGISVTTVDLSEILGRCDRLSVNDPETIAGMERLRKYAPTTGVPEDRLAKMAQLDHVLREWMKENAVDATAIQCWTSLQMNWGCNICTSMSMMSEQMMPSACEVDITGVLTMYAMQLASQTPSALVDWNNNYGNDPDKCVLFHCGNWAKAFQPDGVVSNAPILGSIIGTENTYGAMDGRTPAMPLTFGRLTTSDADGIIRAYVGTGRLTDDALNTFGNRAVAQVPGLQSLMQYVCRMGFEHHVVMNGSDTADILHEAFESYLGWETYNHNDSI